MIRVKLRYVINNQEHLNNESFVSEIVPTPSQDRTWPNGETPLPNIRQDLFHGLDIVDSNFELGTGFRSGSQKRSGLKLALWTWLSAAIDALVLISVSCFFAIAFSFLMKVSPASLISTFIKEQQLPINLVLLFLLSTWSYLIFMRAFIGASIGEWTCDLRLGQPLQRYKATYILKVILRTSLVILTGVFVLPLISLFAGRDIAGDLSGVRIYSLQ